MKKKLKTIQQYKKEVEFQNKWPFWIESGVACPKCKTEMMTPLLTAGSIGEIPKRAFQCPKCDFKITI